MDYNRSPVRSPTRQYSRSRSRSRSRSPIPQQRRYRSPSYSPVPNDRYYSSRHNKHDRYNTSRDRYSHRDTYSSRVQYDRHDRRSPIPSSSQSLHRASKHASNTSKHSSGYSIHVKFLPHGTTSDDLRYEFIRYGELKDIYVPRDYHTKQLRDYAYVAYYNYMDADDAVYDMNGRKIRGSIRPLVVNHARDSRKTPDQMKQIATSQSSIDTTHNDIAYNRHNTQHESIQRQRSRSGSPVQRRYSHQQPADNNNDLHSSNTPPLPLIGNDTSLGPTTDIPNPVTGDVPIVGDVPGM